MSSQGIPHPPPSMPSPTFTSVTPTLASCIWACDRAPYLLRITSFCDVNSTPPLLTPNITPTPPYSGMLALMLHLLDLSGLITLYSGMLALMLHLLDLSSLITLFSGMLVLLLHLLNLSSLINPCFKIFILKWIYLIFLD